MSDRGTDAGTELIGSYEVVRELGHGGMAVVYLARQPGLDRLVALKEMGTFGRHDAQMVHRFLREAQIAASLTHPNIVTVHEAFAVEGLPYIAMEYVAAGSLRSLVGRLRLDQTIAAMHDILAGLGAAEQRGVVHRDLKPENVLITSDGHAKIADFGIAKAVDRAATAEFRTATGMTVGTPTYMAPEQAMSKPVTNVADLYSVGIMAYELMVGRLPFTADSPVALLLKHVGDPPPPPLSINPSLDPEIGAWIERLLVKDAAERTPTAAQAWDELEEIAIHLLGPRWRRQAALLDPRDAQPAPPPASTTSGSGYLTVDPARFAPARPPENPVTFPPPWAPAPAQPPGPGPWTPPPDQAPPGPWTPPPDGSPDPALPGPWTPPPDGSPDPALPGPWTPPPEASPDQALPGPWTPPPEASPDQALPGPRTPPADVPPGPPNLPPASQTPAPDAPAVSARTPPSAWKQPPEAPPVQAPRPPVAFQRPPVVPRPESRPTPAPGDAPAAAAPELETTLAPRRPVVTPPNQPAPPAEAPKSRRAPRMLLTLAALLVLGAAAAIGAFLASPRDSARVPPAATPAPSVQIKQREVETDAYRIALPAGWEALCAGETTGYCKAWDRWERSVMTTEDGMTVWLDHTPKSEWEQGIGLDNIFQATQANLSLALDGFEREGTGVRTETIGDRKPRVLRFAYDAAQGRLHGHVFLFQERGTFFAITGVAKDAASARKAARAMTQPLEPR